jgi:glucose dehydrogenase
MAGTAFEATPIMVDGVVYFATPYSRAIAVDAETRQELWTFDPALDRTDRFRTGGRQ